MILAIFGWPQLVMIGLVVLIIPVGIILLVNSRAKHKARAEAYKEMLEKEEKSKNEGR